MALAYGQLREFDRQKDVLRSFVDDQAALLGNHHPETVESRLELGITLAMTGQRDEAIRLVDDAARALRRGLGFTTDLSGKATVAQGIVRMPYMMIRTFDMLAKFLP